MSCISCTAPKLEWLVEGGGFAGVHGVVLGAVVLGSGDEIEGIFRGFGRCDPRVRGFGPGASSACPSTGCGAIGRARR